MHALILHALCKQSCCRTLTGLSKQHTGTRCSGLPCWLHSCFSAPSVGSFCRVPPAHPAHQSTQTLQLDLRYPKHIVRPCDCLLQTPASCGHAGHAEPAELAAPAEHVDSAEYAAATVAAQAAHYAALKPQHLVHCMPASACCVACWHRATQLPVLAQLELYSLIQLPCLCACVRLMPQ